MLNFWKFDYSHNNLNTEHYAELENILFLHTIKYKFNTVKLLLVTKWHWSMSIHVFYIIN